MSYRHIEALPRSPAAYIAAGVLLALSACASRMSRAHAPVVTGRAAERTEVSGQAEQAGQAAEPRPSEEPEASAAETGAAQETGAAGAGEPVQEAESGVPIHGYLATRYRYRDADDDNSDQDLYVTLALDVGDEERHGMTGHFMARGLADLDGDQNPDENYAFADIWDTYDDSIQGELYYAYVDFHDADPLSKLRAGRQMIYDTPELAHFDGVRVESVGFGSKDIRVGAYGGVPVHLFESSSEGDKIFGALLSADLWTGASARLDYMHLEDERVALDDDDADLWGLHVQQVFDDVLRLEADQTRLDGESRDLTLRGSYYDQEHEFTLQGRFYKLYESQKDLVTELDPFSNSLHRLDPFTQSGMLFTKVIAERFGLDGGFDLRYVEDDKDRGDFNRNVNRYFLTASVSDLPRASTVSLTGEIWKGGGERIETIGLDAGTDLVADSLEASVGSFYSLYKYDSFADDEKDHIRTYYISLTHKRKKAGRLRVRYEFEDGEIDEYHSVRLGWIVNF